MRITTRQIPFAVLGVAALVWAGISVRAWTADDAFISFRYARNLIDGNGLVFNVGERVEGYTNFLWTLWTAAGLAMGFAAETWTRFWGGVSLLGSIGLLLWNSIAIRREVGRTAVWIPIAAVGVALHRDWSLFATGGLETGSYTFLLLAGTLLVVRAKSNSRTLAIAGIVFGLAALSRPDGILPAFVAGLYVLATAKHRLRAGSAFGLVFLALWLPYTAWRVAYYGDFFPNTYYAKSAWLPWYEQGWHYLVLYFEKYWTLAFGPILLALSFVVRPRIDDSERSLLRQAALAGAIALSYTFYVVRVGGDFMFARFLIPATPFYLLLLELGWIRLFRALPIQGLAVAAVLLAGVALTPSPVSGDRWRYGIADEYDYYSGDRLAALNHKSEVLSRYFAGTDVRVAFYGDEARVVYAAGFAWAFESHAGLTEPAVAHQPLAERGRPGHEKHASALYLIETRHADITFSAVPQRLIRLRAFIPEVIVQFDDTVSGQLLRWNPELVNAIRLRGAHVPPFIEMFDGYLAQMDSLPDGRVASDWPRFKRFYFDAVDDPVRESRFRKRLAGVSVP